MPSQISESSIVQAQLDSLDDTDCYASVWNDILAQHREKSTASGGGLWGGRGKGGRGLARQTVQPYDIVVKDVRLQYLQGDVFLKSASLKLLRGHKYALCGKNGCGKSTLLQRMHAQKIPGWSPRWSSVYLPPELPSEFLSFTPMEVLERYQADLFKSNRIATEAKIEEVQEQLDALGVDQEELMENLCEELSKLEEHLDESENLASTIETVLKELEMDDSLGKTCSDLSPGQQKRVLLGVAMLLESQTNLMLLDEPTAHLDIFGLVLLRRILEACPATVVLISHDVDFINDVATDVIDMRDLNLCYYPGNYDSYRVTKEQQDMHELRNAAALEKKRGHLLKTLKNVKEQPVPKRGGAKKKAKAVSNQKKKLERHFELEKSAAVAVSSIGIGGRKPGLTVQQRLKLAEILMKVPDKAIQFNFGKVNAKWYEPLITAIEIGFSFHGQHGTIEDAAEDEEATCFRVTKKDGFVFDCVDICINEGSRHCICGPSASGKSTLLQLLAKRLAPTEGSVVHASGLTVGYFDASLIHEEISSMVNGDESTTALEYLSVSYPRKTEEEFRAHLTAFGLSPQIQAKTPAVFLSSGEKCRFLLASVMIKKPPVLCLDDPTLHLDVESVQALMYGLRQWDGTIILVSSDANFLRSFDDMDISVLVPDEGKLRRVAGDVDTYVRSF